MGGGGCSIKYFNLQRRKLSFIYSSIHKSIHPFIHLSIYSSNQTHCIFLGLLQSQETYFSYEPPIFPPISFYYPLRPSRLRLAADTRGGLPARKICNRVPLCNKILIFAKSVNFLRSLQNGRSVGLFF